jgi:hypothetical protein
MSPKEYRASRPSSSTMCNAVASLSRAKLSNQSTAQLNGPSKEGHSNSASARAWSPRSSRIWSRAAR